MTRRTSAEAYAALVSEGLLPLRRRVVYDALFRWGPATAGELVRRCKEAREEVGRGAAPFADAVVRMGRNNAAARLRELRISGNAYEVEERPCEVSGRRCIVVDVTSAATVQPLQAPAEGLDPVAHAHTVRERGPGERLVRVLIAYQEDVRVPAELRRVLPDAVRYVRDSIRSGGPATQGSLPGLDL